MTPIDNNVTDFVTNFERIIEKKSSRWNIKKIGFGVIWIVAGVVSAVYLKKISLTLSFASGVGLSLAGVIFNFIPQRQPTIEERITFCIETLLSLAQKKCDDLIQKMNDYSQQPHTDVNLIYSTLSKLEQNYNDTASSDWASPNQRQYAKLFLPVQKFYEKYNSNNRTFFLNVVHYFLYGRYSSDQTDDKNQYIEVQNRGNTFSFTSRVPPKYP